MYGIFTYIWFIFMVNVGKYTIHGSYGDYKFTRFEKVLTVNDVKWVCRYVVMIEIN